MTYQEFSDCRRADWVGPDKGRFGWGNPGITKFLLSLSDVFELAMVWELVILTTVVVLELQLGLVPSGLEYERVLSLDCGLEKVFLRSQSLDDVVCTVDDDVQNFQIFFFVVVEKVLVVVVVVTFHPDRQTEDFLLQAQAQAHRLLLGNSCSVFDVPRSWC